MTAPSLAEERDLLGFITMAIEYRLRFSSSTPEEVAILLAHLPRVADMATPVKLS